MNELVFLGISLVLLCFVLFKHQRLLKSFSSLQNELINSEKDKEFLQFQGLNSNREILELKKELLAKQQALEDNKSENARLNEELKNTKILLDNQNIKLDLLNDSLKKTTQDYYEELSENKALSEKNVIFEDNLKKLEEKYENMLKTLNENLKEQNEKNSKLIYEENTRILLNNSNELLGKIFSPLKEKISEYERTLLKQNASIESNIKTMFETSQNLNHKAEEFAKILKGDKKIRGNFGEIMLKNCLLASGLIENEHFFMQEAFKDDENNTKIPDAIVKFEPNKCVVIDSKFSLPSELDSPDFKSELAKNLSYRIDELSSKKYEQAVKYSNEYVILFVPYQNILDLALQADANLFAKAETKKIFLASPTTLFMGLKMIYLGWRNYEINHNVHAIFEEFGKFYDKFALLYEDFESHKRQSLNALNKIDKHLYGNGGLNKRLEKLKSLGAKAKKELPKDENILRLE